MNEFMDERTKKKKKQGRRKFGWLKQRNENDMNEWMVKYLVGWRLGRMEQRKEKDVDEWMKKKRKKHERNKKIYKLE